MFSYLEGNESHFLSTEINQGEQKMLLNKGKE